LRENTVNQEVKKLVARMGAVVAFQRKGSEKPERVCLCGRADTGAHAPRHDCRLVSCSAPVGQALLGKEVGDKAVVRTPGGSYELTITAIEYDTAANAA
jgi:transcription elongation GreA/GreB family factor